MRSLPNEMIPVVQPFAPAFSQRVWEHVKVLIVGAIVVPGQRTVAAVLRVIGLSQDGHFQNYHRVLNRPQWASRALSPILLRSLLAAFVAQEAPVIVGIDEHGERRRGAKIAAKGIYRDGAPFGSRSSGAITKTAASAETRGARACGWGRASATDGGGRRRPP